MKSLSQKIIRFLIVPLQVATVWMIFLLTLWISGGIAGGYPAFLMSVAIAGIFLWPRIRQGTRRAVIWSGMGLLLALVPLVIVLVPLASSSLPALAADKSVQLWATHDGRHVAVYRYSAAPANDRHMALVFAHGGPGAYLRDFDRNFFASFAHAGFDVVIYDQFGAGRSPLGDPTTYTHENNVRDLAAVLARVDKPTVLIGQSYGATLVTSALSEEEIRKHVTHVILSEPGRLPGSTESTAKSMSEKTTLAPDASETPSRAVIAKVAAPRALLANFLPRENRFVKQEELINLYTADVQRLLIAPGFCKGDTTLLNSFKAEPFNLKANVAINRDALAAPTPDLRKMKAPVMLLLGECSYIPRGLAMEYFGTYSIKRSQRILGVGHILWGNPRGQAMTRDAIIRFIENAPAALPNDPTAATANRFVDQGR
ncbi:alpha/beta hydrolase [Massilia sp. 9096]|uniref:alpha/beta hydrolase n=1 Tax=Massilia sp. 9096 TaxID=1500894 RepID=UPI000559E0BA|nr:alpha/beta hydrolase [Massilia sp. 9096]